MHPLQQPRLLVTAPYPFSPYRVGEVVTPSVGIIKLVDFNGEPDFVQIRHALATFPNLFRLCEWWEFRKESEMPEYVRIVVEHQKLPSGCVREVSSWVKSKLGLRGDSFPCYLIPEWCLPATETEYNNYTIPATMTAAEQAAAKKYPEIKAHCSVPAKAVPNLKRSAFISGHAEGINHAIATLRGLGYAEAADILEQELFVSTPGNPVPKNQTQL